MRRSRAKNRPVAEINVVPYIDVMMVLLVIFIATAPVVMQGVTVDLPQAESEQMSEELKTPIVCTADVNGRYFVDLGDSHIEVRELNELTSIVSDYLMTRPGSPVVVQGDAHASYDSVVQLMNALKRAGVESVGLVTQPISN
ncbi:MAG: protein TolR [Ruminobacter sp.]|uniref:Tol-Pal system protein TolR n=2 Tax=Succinivibrionaceae TaxID=83763 RepID=A0A662ZHI4_9GAMM|nr:MULTISPECIES: protein TolR [Ruminobacter]MBQ3775886.1 protein TolR [Ruminobacter sp.]SFP42149.1 biopolymer transport protein TolR [Ruminobacter amylophilus]